MYEKMLRKLFLGFIQVHILHHSCESPFYGSWMIAELQGHGYQMSPGTLYPLLHSMESAGLLVKEVKNEGGRLRKYYSITDDGRRALEEARHRAAELVRELNLNRDNGGL